MNSRIIVRTKRTKYVLKPSTSKITYLYMVMLCMKKRKTSIDQLLPVIPDNIEYINISDEGRKNIGAFINTISNDERILKEVLTRLGKLDETQHDAYVNFIVDKMFADNCLYGQMLWCSSIVVVTIDEFSEFGGYQNFDHYKHYRHIVGACLGTRAPTNLTESLVLGKCTLEHQRNRMCGAGRMSEAVFPGKGRACIYYLYLQYGNPNPSEEYRQLCDEWGHDWRKNFTKEQLEKGSLY